MEIKGNHTSFRPNDPPRPERAVPTGAPQRDSDSVGAERRRLAANQPEVVSDALTKRQLRQLRLANIAADKRAEGAGNTEGPVAGDGSPITQRRRLAANKPEVVTDELSKRQLRQLRLANIAADLRADGAGNTERPVPGGGVDSISVSSSAERLAKVEDTVRKFETPSRSARLGELRQAFQNGDLNTAELMKKTAEEMLSQRSKLG